MFEAATAARPKEEEPRREESEAAPLGAEVFKDVGQDQGGGGIGPGRCTVGGGAAPGNPEECRGSRRRDGGFATAVADAGCWVVQSHGWANRDLMLEPNLASGRAAGKGRFGLAESPQSLPGVCSDKGPLLPPPWG